jgi:glutamate:GABA antiporter
VTDKVFDRGQAIRGSLFAVSGVLLIDQLPAVAKIGQPVIGWWLLLFAIFMLPYALICSYLGSNIPSTGGIHAWIDRAFGPRWAARAVWCYWFQITIWIPSVALLSISSLDFAFSFGLSLSAKVIGAILFTWAVAIAGCLRLDVAAWLPASGAVIKIMLAILMGLLIAGGGVMNEGLNLWSLSAYTPSISGQIEYLPVLVLCMMGIELAAILLADKKPSHRTLLSATLGSSAIIIAFYVLCSIALISTMSAEEFELDNGLILFFQKIMGTGGSAIVIIYLAIFYVFLTNMLTWSLAINEAMAGAAEAGSMPMMLGKRHSRTDAPIAANLIAAFLSTIVILIYAALADTSEDLFWTLTAFSTCVFLLPYFLVFWAPARLQPSAPERAPGYIFLGGNWSALLSALSCSAVAAIAILLFIHTPGADFDPVYSSSIVVGLVTSILLGEICLRLSSTYRKGHAGSIGRKLGS